MTEICDISEYMFDRYYESNFCLFEKLHAYFGVDRKEYVLVNWECGCYETTNFLDEVLVPIQQKYNIPNEKIVLGTSRLATKYTNYRSVLIDSIVEGNWFDLEFDEVPIPNQPRDTLFGCFMGRANSERIYTLQELLLSKNYFERNEFLISFHHDLKNIFMYPSCEEWTKTTDVPLKQVAGLSPVSDIDEIKQPPINEWNGAVDTQLWSKVYGRIVVDVIQESSPCGIGFDFNEKTHRAFYFGAIPVLINGVHSIKYLRHFGFDMFDDLISHDYDRFEGILRVQQALEALYHAKEKILNHPKDQLIKRFANNKKIIYKLQKLQTSTRIKFS